LLERAITVRLGVAWMCREPDTGAGARVDIDGELAELAGDARWLAHAETDHPTAAAARAGRA